MLDMLDMLDTLYFEKYDVFVTIVASLIYSGQLCMSDFMQMSKASPDLHLSTSTKADMEVQAILGCKEMTGSISLDTSPLPTLSIAADILLVLSEVCDMDDDEMDEHAFLDTIVDELMQQDEEFITGSALCTPYW
jgi:hypothetical protein